MVLSESLQALVEAMHTSRAQTNQALRKLLHVGVATHVSPGYMVLSSLAPILFQRAREAQQQYPIPLGETARIMCPVLAARRYQASAV